MTSVVFPRTSCSSTRWSLISSRELTPDHTRAWGALLDRDPANDSPFLRPEFTQLVGTVRADGEVVVLWKDEIPVGFFPFQRWRHRFGVPIGRPLSGFQGFVVSAEIAWRPEQLLDAAQLNCWEFDHLNAQQVPFQGFHFNTEPLPQVDLSGGFAGFQRDLQEKGSRLLKRVGKLKRKLEREVGPVRFDFHTAESGILDTLLQWKSAQYRDTGLTNVLSFRWIGQLLQAALRYQASSFAGVLSTLRAGDRVVGATFSLRSHGVMHGWFTGYNRDMGRYSPGLIQFVELIRVGPDCGVRRLDLGRGLSPFKSRFCNSYRTVAVGCVTASDLRRNWLMTRQRLVNWAKTCPCALPIRVLARWARPLRDWILFR